MQWVQQKRSCNICVAAKLSKNRMSNNQLPFSYCLLAL